MSHHDHQPCRDTHARRGATRKRTRGRGLPDAEVAVGASAPTHTLQYLDTPGAAEDTYSGSPVSHQPYPYVPLQGSASGHMYLDAPYAGQPGVQSSGPRQPYAPYEGEAASVFGSPCPYLPAGEPSTAAFLPDQHYATPSTRHAPGHEIPVPAHQYPYAPAPGVTPDHSYWYPGAITTGQATGGALGEAYTAPETLAAPHAALQGLGALSLTHDDLTQQALEGDLYDLQEPLGDITNWDLDYLEEPSQSNNPAAALAPGGAALASGPLLQGPGLASPATAAGPSSGPSPAGKSRDHSRKPKLYDLGPQEDEQKEMRRLRAKRQKYLRDKAKAQEQQQQAALQALMLQVQDLQIEKNSRQHAVQHLEAEVGRRNLAPGQGQPLSESGSEAVPSQSRDQDRVPREAAGEALDDGASRGRERRNEEKSDKERKNEEESYKERKNEEETNKERKNEEGSNKERKNEGESDRDKGTTPDEDNEKKVDP